MRLSVRTKLFGAFAVVLALLAIAAGVAIVSMAGMNDKTHAIAAVDLPSAQIIGDIRGSSADYRAMLYRQVALTDRASMLDTGKLIAASSAGVDKAFARYEPILLDGRDRALFESARSLWRQYHAGTAGVSAMTLRGDNGRALATMMAQKAVFDRFSAGLKSWTDYNVALGATDAKAASSTYSSARTLVLVIAALALLFGAALAFLLARSIVSGVRQMLHAADGIAEGVVDHEVTVRSKDELGETAQAFERMIAYLRDLAEGAQRIAAGDLTVAITPKSERDLLGNAFEKMTEDLRRIVGEVSGAANSMSAASQQMATTSEEAGRAVTEIAGAVGEVAAGAERQVRAVESVKVAAEQTAEAAQDSAGKTQEVTAVAEETRTVAQEGVAAAEQATAAMHAVAASSQDVTDAIRDLAAKSEQIGGIVATITGIAEQTNLLALNAAIEAARAGEQGRGFAVVAEEVRKLAESSQEAAASIAQLIGQIQTETNRVVDVVEDGAQRTSDGTATVAQTRAAFERIGVSVDDVTARIGQIAGAVQQISAEAAKVQQDIGEVAAVAEQSSASTEEVSASTEQTSASAQEISASAQELANTAAELQRLVGHFTVTR
jgi:methyl-accepting chemotaxis protein